ncbi:MAG: hypothetical protein B1H13_05490 [Desulfobacteraceae bacterium 4484_190.3]|nr:MAG: hypothetical protein B1H13_05490 [Desulfobacteraceae bacterium 4484_190.3]
MLKAVEVSPDNVKARSRLGILYVQQKKYDKAIEQYKTVSQLDPARTDAFFNLGYLYAVKKNYADAEKMYKRVVELKPDYLDEALFNLAMVQRHLGNEDACIANLEKALEINPGNARVKKYLNKSARCFRICTGSAATADKCAPGKSHRCSAGRKCTGNNKAGTCRTST